MADGSAINGGSPPLTIYGVVFRAAKEWGLFAVLVVFFIWRMEFVNEDTNKFVREKLLDALDRNTTAWGRVEQRLRIGKPAEDTQAAN